jgi:hypothetical protein
MHLSGGSRACLVTPHSRWVDTAVVCKWWCLGGGALGRGASGGGVGWGVGGGGHCTAAVRREGGRGQRYSIWQSGDTAQQVSSRDVLRVEVLCVGGGGQG